MALTTAQASSRLATLQGQLTDLARSMKLAKDTGQVTALEMFRVQYRQLAAEAAALRAQINRSEMPGSLVLQLDTFSDRVLTVGRQIGEFPAGLGATFRFFPVIVGGLALLGLLAFLWANRRK